MTFNLGILLIMLPSIIPLIAWIIAVILAGLWAKSGNSRGEQFFLIAAALFLLGSLIGALLSLFILQPAYFKLGARTIGIISSIVGLLRTLLFIPGVVLLLLAFWKKFKAET